MKTIIVLTVMAAMVFACGREGTPQHFPVNAIIASKDILNLELDGETRHTPIQSDRAIF